MKKKNPKSKRGEAERATVWYAREVLGCIYTRRAVRTQWQTVDFFGSDIVGKRSDGSHVYIQTTAGQDSAVTARRRKLEKIPWHESDTVQLVQLRQTEDPANARRKLWFFRVHVYEKAKGLLLPTKPDDVHKRSWITLTEAVVIPRGWFKAWKEPENLV